MKFKKYGIIIGIVLLILILSINGYIRSANMYYNSKEQIDTSDSWSLDFADESVENNKLKGSYKLSGYGTIWTYDSDSEFDLEIPYTLKVNSGKAKLILISPDNEVTTLVENTKNSQVTGNSTITVHVKKGLNRIKLVGFEKANIELEVSIDKGELTTIGFKKE